MEEHRLDRLTEEELLEAVPSVSLEKAALEAAMVIKVSSVVKQPSGKRTSGLFLLFANSSFEPAMSPSIAPSIFLPSVAIKQPFS